MRRLLLIAVVGLIVGAALVNLIERDPGYVFISLGSVTVETSFWFATLLWLVAWAVLAGLLAAVRTTLRSGRLVQGWVGGRKARNAGALTNRGLITFIEGHWARARKQLLRSAKYSDAPLVNHLLAAQASFRLGDMDAMRQQLGDAEAIDAGAGIAVELTQAELQLSAGHYEEALATLVRARSNASKHPHVLELLARAHRRLEDWEALRALLPELRRHNLLAAPPLEGLEAQMWYALVDSACARGDDPESLQSLWQSIPLDWRETDPLRIRFVSCLLSRGSSLWIEKQLVAMLDRAWSTELVALIGTFTPVDAKRLAKAVGRWLEGRGQDVVLLSAAARLALHREEWTQARTWLEQANELESNATTCFELARLCGALGDRIAADHYLRMGGNRLLDTAPNTPLPNIQPEPQSPR